MGRLSKQKVIDALHHTKGAAYLAAKRLGCSHGTVYNYINRYDDVREVKEYYDEELNDIAALKLREAIMSGDLGAIKYQLSTKGKDRGYTERREIDHTIKWREELVGHIKDGRLSFEEVRGRLGDSLARELFSTAGITSSGN